MTTLNSTIQVRRGTAAQMPTVLLVGELYFQTDTSKLYAGTGTSVVPVSGGGAVASVFGRTGTVVAEATDYAAVDNVEVQDTRGNGMVVDTPGGLVDFTAQDEVSIVGGACEINIGDQGDGTSLSITTGGSAAITTDTAGNVLTLAGTEVHVPTPTTSDNSTKAASTAYVKAQASSFDAAGSAATAQSNAETFATTAVGVETTRAETAEALLAPLASPALTGNPTVPTQTASTNNTRAASTAYTDLAVGVETTRATTAEALLAPKASPTFTGTVTVPTPTTGDNTTKAASTAYVKAQIAADAPGLAPVQTVAGRTGAVVLAESDITSLVSDLALKAPLASPALTGNPTAPTAAAATNNTQIATTAFVESEIPLRSAVLSVAGHTGVVTLAESDIASLTTDLAAKQATLTGTGLARNTGASTELSGDVTTSGSNATTLKNTGTAGTYTKVTTDAQGRVSSGTVLTPSDLPNANAVGSAAFEVAASVQNGTSSIVSQSLALTVVRGDCVVLFVQNANWTGAGSTSAAGDYISDNGGNDYFFVGVVFTSAVAIVKCYVCLNANHAASQVYFATTTSAAMQMAGATYSGVASLGATASSISLGATTAGTIALTPLNTNSIMVACFVWYKSGSTITVSANVGNLRTNKGSVSSAFEDGICIVDTTETGTGSESCSVTASAAPTGWAVFALELVHN